MRSVTVLFVNVCYELVDARYATRCGDCLTIGGFENRLVHDHTCGTMLSNQGNGKLFVGFDKATIAFSN